MNRASDIRTSSETLDLFDRALLCTAAGRVRADRSCPGLTKLLFDMRGNVTATT